MFFWQFFRKPEGDAFSCSSSTTTSNSTTKRYFWKRVPEISATRLSLSGGLRPRLGLSLTLLTLFLSLIFFILWNFSSYFSVNIPPSLSILMASKDDSLHLFHEKENKIVLSNNGFSMSLYREVTGGAKSPNFVLSGFSLHSLLSLSALGASSETKNQIVRLLQFPEDFNLGTEYSKVSKALLLGSDTNCTLEIANNLFLQHGFPIKDSFLQIAKEAFKASPTQVDFKEPEASLKIINDWTENETHGKIVDLLPNGCLSAETRIVLINAIYFKGTWSTQFNVADTEKKSFFVSQDKTVQTDTMTVKAKFGFVKNKELDASIVEMPYVGDRMSMYIFLPNEKFALNSMESKLINFNFESLSTMISESRIKIQLSIPKFKVESTYKLEEPLKKLGLTDMFDESKANFSGISDTPLFVSKVIQKAMIEVNEEGSEAAAASGMVMMMRSMPMPQPEVIINHPFYFVIRDKVTGINIFSGKVTDPSV